MVVSALGQLLSVHGVKEAFLCEFITFNVCVRFLKVVEFF